MTVGTWVAASWGGGVLTAERLVRLQVRRRRLRMVALVLAPLVLVGAVWGIVSAVLPSPVARSGRVALWRTASGLKISLPFDRPAPLRDIEDTFSFGGSASAGVGYAAVGSGGLSVGVHRHPARFEGWFAVTRAGFPASGVYHVRMAKPRGEVQAAGAQGEAVFAVQTGTTKVTGLINYVVIASNSQKGKTVWSVGYAHGHLADAHLDQFAVFHVARSSPPVRDVTLRTDGRHRLTVWFGDRLVFTSHRLNLDIAPPFQPYLEVQARTISYASSFQGFWVTSSSAVTVAAPDGARVRLVAPGGRTIARATARHGDARLLLPPPRAEGTGNLVVRFGGRSERLGPFTYAGGDRYRLSGLKPAR